MASQAFKDAVRYANEEVRKRARKAAVRVELMLTGDYTYCDACKQFSGRQWCECGNEGHNNDHPSR